jgi:hypothetical protein
MRPARCSRRMCRSRYLRGETLASSKHYFARLIDRDNGQVVAENPTEAQLKLFAISRQLLGKILKTEA